VTKSNYKDVEDLEVYKKMMIRYIRNKIESVNCARGEAAETIHHLFMAKLKGYITEKVSMRSARKLLKATALIWTCSKTLSAHRT